MAKSQTPKKTAAARAMRGRGTTGRAGHGTQKPAPDRTRKRTVTLPASQIAEVEEFSGPGGFSAVTSQALAQWLALEKTKAAIADYEAEAGEITQAEMDALKAKWGGV